jgi:protein gp37
MIISQKRIDKGLYWEKAWTLISGCSKVSEGCQNCWSEREYKRFHKEDWNEIILRTDKLSLPAKTKKPTVFAIWNDLFNEQVPFDFIDKIWWQKRHIYLILTKRPQRMYECFTRPGVHLELINNIWLGVTAENQEMADERIPILLDIPVENKFVSIEPCLEYVNIRKLGIKWVICGAESGKNRRECKIEWIENIVEQNKIVNIPVFVKQIHINGKLVKDINQFPKIITYREFPF